MEELKKIAGVTAAKYVEDGMVVGLGTGSTAYFFVEEIGRRIKEEGLSVVGVTTSSQTTKQAEGLGIPLKAVDDIDSIDVTVDGADEVDPQLNGIKGGGGALLMEKIVATPTKEYIWVVDESKMVDQLGAFKLPVKWFNMVLIVCIVSLSRRVISHHSDLRSKVTALLQI